MPKPRYMITTEAAAELQTRFTYHAPTPDQITRYQEIRDQAYELAQLIAEDCPQSREKSLAITHLEQTVFWANASIARHEHE